MVWSVTQTLVELLVWIGILGCGHPIYMRFWHNGTIYLAVTNNPTNSVSDAEDMTYLIISAIVRTGPLWHGTGSFYVRMMWAPTWLRALLTLRYDAPTWAARII